MKEPLINRLQPAAMELLNKKEEFHPHVIGELKEYLSYEKYWKEIPYYVLEHLVCHIYGFDNNEVTESKVEILFTHHYE